MSVSDQERSLRRRIVFHAMNGKATPAAIKSTLTLLDSEFGNVEKFRFNELIQRMSQTLESAEANLGRILSEIMVLRSQPEDRLGPDPLEGSASATISGRPPSVPKQDSVSKREGIDHVFATMIESLVANLRHRADGSEKKMLDAVISSPELAKIGERMSAPFKEFAKQPDPGTLHVRGTIDEYRSIVHLVYVWLCNKLGPVEADRSLGAVVRAAEQLPEAVQHPPGQLL